jgi:hypothetical protein
MAAHGQHKRLLLVLQPALQTRISAIDLIACHPRPEHTGRPHTGQHALCQLRLGHKRCLIGNACLLTVRGIVCPTPWEVEFTVNEGPALGTGIGHKHTDLAVFDATRRARVLSLHRNRLRIFFQKAGLIKHQDRLQIVQVLADMGPQVIMHHIDVFYGPSTVFTNVFNPHSQNQRMDELRPTLVRQGATFGANCIIVCGVTIGKYAFIGAGAVVVKDVPGFALVVGNPARIIGWMCVCWNRIDFEGRDGSGACRVCQQTYKKAGQEVLLVW